MPIKAILFDVDDTLYDVGTGFTAHRNGYGATSFMVEYLNFPDMPTAKLLRDEYFAKYHSTAKALSVAEDDGRLPPAPEGDVTPKNKRRFDPQQLSDHWATSLDFSILNGPYPDLLEMLRSCPLPVIAFSNGPRTYVLRVLKELGLSDIFPADKLFAVDDLLPFCKPDPQAFDLVLKKLGLLAEECVLVEDSMKNIRVAKELGMKTILVTGKKSEVDSEEMKAAELTKMGDVPMAEDAAVDVSVESCEEIRGSVPCLWETPSVWRA